MAVLKQLARVATALVGVTTTVAAQASLQKDAFWNLPTGVTEMSREEYNLHMMALWVCVGIGVLVFGAMLYSLIMHRRSRHPVPAKFHESTKVEILWTVIPFLILVGMAIPATGTLIKAYNTKNAAVTIVVTGLQWKWLYEYPQQGVRFYSSLTEPSIKAAALDSGINPRTVPHYLRDVDHPMVVPVNKKIRLLITSADVDHGWWVEDLGVKKNAYPGFINEDWFKADRIGTYRGQCSVLCGYGHAYMPIVVKVVSEADFEKWSQKMGADGFAYKPRTALLASMSKNAAARAAQPVAPSSVTAAQP